MQSVFTSPDVLLEDFVTEYIQHTDDAETFTVRVIFESTALFDPLSFVFPSEAELIAALEDAFTGENLNGYLGMVQALPNTNLFSDTTQILYLGTIGTETYRSESVLVPLIASWCAGLAILGSGMAVYTLYRNKREQREQGNPERMPGKSIDDVGSEIETELLSHSGSNGVWRDARSLLEVSGITRQSSREDHVGRHEDLSCTQNEFGELEPEGSNASFRNINRRIEMDPQSEQERLLDAEPNDDVAKTSLNPGSAHNPISMVDPPGKSPSMLQDNALNVAAGEDQVFPVQDNASFGGGSSYRAESFVSELTNPTSIGGSENPISIESHWTTSVSEQSQIGSLGVSYYEAEANLSADTNFAHFRSEARALVDDEDEEIYSSSQISLSQ